MSRAYLGDDLVTVLSVDEQTPTRETHILFTDGQEIRVPFRWLVETSPRTTQLPKMAHSQREATSLTLVQVIREAGGIAPHRKGTEGALTEEYQRAVPLYLRNRQGRPADEVADMLGEHYPQFGVETENDLYEALKSHLQRTGAFHERT